MRQNFFLAVIGCCVCAPAPAQSSAQPSAAAVAREIDASLAAEVFSKETKLAPPASDEVFLRRLWLDVVGDVPTPEETIAFVLDPSDQKRQQVVSELLDQPAYGQNWSRYWRDVIFYRALDERSKIARLAMETDLTKRLNENVPWDRIASEFITARGDVLENGSTAIVMAQDGRTEETTAEVSRILLGIQIQCAQCHDHPYDDWRREQFHELAAFFPRVGIKPVREVTRRSFAVIGEDKPSRPNDNNNRPQPEHFMSDLEDPDAKGTEMQPRFFLTGDSLPLGTTDRERRQQLAEWLTESPWFATALVNRIWSELVGEGFYETIDDLGPDREPTAPATVKILADRFRDSGYDLKWLLSTICQTEAYGRASWPRRGPTDTPFTANVPQRLRSDQLLNAIYTALEVEEEPARTGKQRVFKPGRRMRARQQFDDVFGYDPSIAREEVGSSIPQVLALMNSPQLNQLIATRKKSRLQRLLEEVSDDEQLVVELYLRWLCRQPSDEEVAQALAHRRSVDRRAEAFEDLQWALLNSAEFQHRR
jgi:hypothetical protein